MATTPEGKVKDAVKKVLKKMGVYQFWPVQTGLGAKTVDCLVCVRGHFVGIETKAPGKSPTPLQQITLNYISETGGTALVIDSVDVAKRLPEILDAAYRTFQAQQSPRAEPADGGVAGENAWPLI